MHVEYHSNWFHAKVSYHHKVPGDECVITVLVTSCNRVGIQPRFHQWADGAWPSSAPWWRHTRPHVRPSSYDPVCLPAQPGQSGPFYQQMLYLLEHLWCWKGPLTCCHLNFMVWICKQGICGSSLEESLFCWKMCANGNRSAVLAKLQESFICT